MGLVKGAIGDAILTFIWVSSLPILRLFKTIIATALGADSVPLAGRFITNLLVTLLVLICSSIGKAMGGASFNPSTTLSLYAAGLKSDFTLLSMAVRFPAQAFGGVCGAMTVFQVMPQQYKWMLSGPSLKVDMHTGAMAEGLLTFARNLGIFFVIVKGPRNQILQVWFVGVVTSVLNYVGSGYTGPSMNPASAFGWVYVNNWPHDWEHFYVYWICPFIGATLAATVYRKGLLFSPTSKQKKS